MVNLLKARGVTVSLNTPMLELIMFAISEFGSDKYYSITNDGHPSLLATADGRIFAQRPYDQGGDTPLGAGDAYFAALIYALTADHSPETALMYAAINGYYATFAVDSYSGHQTEKQINEAISQASEGFEPIQIFPLPSDTVNPKVTQILSELDPLIDRDAVSSDASTELPRELLYG